jgi:glutamine synthetase
VRDADSPLATRFEVRAPNPHTNTYLAVSAFAQAMLDGMGWAAGSGRSARELQEDFSKEPGVAHAYLEKDRAYRSEENVFEDFSPEERDRLFGKPPATVWETLANLERHSAKTATLQVDGVFSTEVLASYRAATLLRWSMELTDRIIPENARAVQACVQLPGENTLDANRWTEIQALREELARDDVDRTSIFTRIREAVAKGDLAAVSALQLDMGARMQKLGELYRTYRRNIGPA